MKKILMNPRGLWIMAAVLAIGMIGCKKTDPDVPTLSTWYNDVVNNSIQFNNVPVVGATHTIGVSGNRDWVISVPASAASWVTVSPGSGSASQTEVSVTITIAANTGDARSTTLSVAATDNSITRSVAISQSGGDSPGGEAIYFEDLGDAKSGAEIRTASGITSGWPTIEQFGSADPTNAWRRGGSLDQSGVVYTGTAQVRNSGVLYDPVAGSSISQAPYVSMGTTYNFSIGNINLGGNTNLTLKFALQNTVSTAPDSPYTPTFGDITTTTVHLQAGFNGTSWANLTYTVGEADGNGWYWVTSEFKVPAGTTNLYLNFSEFRGGATLRLEDFTLTVGGNGIEIDPDAEDSVLGVSSETVTVAAEGGNATVDVTGNVAWTAEVIDGAANLTSGPTPASGSNEGTITLVFAENTDTENTKTVTLRVSTTAPIALNSYDVIFTQVAASTGTEQTATFVMSAMGLENAADWNAQTVNGITITADGGGNSNTPKFYTGDNSLRTYVNNTLTFTGGTITEIEFTMVRNNGLSASPGDLVAPEDATSGIWTGSSNSVVFTTTTGQVRYTTITVTYR